MANNTENQKSNNYPFKIHPRVFEALGSQLITNDTVAVVELVKNSYDALATRVDIRFIRNAKNGKLRLEIQDDGTGMSDTIIKDVWLVIATPYRMNHPIAKQGKRIRRASGEKGLGRLSAARLGQKLELFTKQVNKPCWKLNITWEDLTNAANLADCTVMLEICEDEIFPNSRGTLIRILDLNSDWDDSKKVMDLREQLSRLLSPFAEVNDFEIGFVEPDGSVSEPTKVTPPNFLGHPPYVLTGDIDSTGFVSCNYRHSNKANREEKITQMLWSPADFGDVDEGEANLTPTCGPFTFEIRAWDIDSDSLDEIASEFDTKKQLIRGAIKNYQGISVYRDGILVLPKTSSARDWLGLDLRRVSKVGTRLSTSQVVGYVAITAKENKEIQDTSDRERLVENLATRDFKLILWKVVAILENERSKDRMETKKELLFQDLFSDLSSQQLVESVTALANEGASASEVLPLVEEHETKVRAAVDQIQHRLVYYSRLASLGTLASLVVHEVRNQIFAFSSLIDVVGGFIEGKVESKSNLKHPLQIAQNSVRSLERMADRFAPLGTRAGRTRRKDSILEEIFQDCLSMREKEINSRKIEVKFDNATKTEVAVDPGELTSIFDNLISNSVYWLSSGHNRERRIQMVTNRRGTRVDVQIDDSGPGIEKGDEERIFYPGVTRRPEGIGMGLTVVAELVSQYGGKLALVKPGVLNGASFNFDLPLVKETK